MNDYIGQQIIKQTDYRQQISDGKRLLQMLASGLFVITIVTILQDLIHSRLNNYSFYFSESLLFKTFWLLFLPLLLVQLNYLRKTNTKTVFRTLTAVLAPTLVHLLLVPLVIFAASAVFYSHTYSYYQTLRYTVSEDVYKLLLVYSFSFSLYKYVFAKAKLDSKEIAEPTVKPFDAGKTKIEDNPKERTTALETLVISNGRKYIPISVNAILYVSAATPYVSIQLENERFLHTETLKSINEKLDKTQFIRIHKSTIVNLNKVVSYKSRLNGDYDLLLENGTEIRLSRNYNAEFKERFKTRPQVNK
jgi:two-component system LytT family response regulator